MRFLIDASVRRSVGTYLLEQGHGVRFLAGTADHALDDDAVLAIANSEERILITNDQDFGRLIFLQSRPHRGVIFFRLSLESSRFYIERLQHALAQYGANLHDHYLVVTDTHIRSRSTRT